MSETLALPDLPSSRFTSHVSRFTSRVRRNHALEHATIHVLSERYRGLRLMGRSSLWGFYIYGQVPTEGVLAAAQEGLQRLKAGRWQMAIHPQCGSNLVIGGTLAGLGAAIALAGKPRGCLNRIARLPLVFAAATLGLILARPLGAVFQARVTTQPDVGDLRIIGITREERTGILVHHVRTEG
ncbi:MAG: hypothetical protein IMY75_12865 [Chloroflexi bacterium]|nr:hypothetical protein [Chloroflexota bacterium]